MRQKKSQRKSFKVNSRLRSRQSDTIVTVDLNGQTVLSKQAPELDSNYPELGTLIKKLFET